MELTLKDATAALRSTDEETSDPNGSFEIVLSTATKDRDGEEVMADEWEQPLPDHIVMDIDHGMSAATTVGSGVPALEDGKLVVRGTFASTELGQTMRKLVNEKHIRSTSVAFMRKSKPSEEKDGVPTVTRELLNGAFVAIPANPEAVVMASKANRIVDEANAPAIKLGARNNSNDAANLQAIHDAASNMGASCGTPPAEDAPAADAANGKAIDPNVGGGVDRSKLKPGDFVFPDEKTFPVVTPGDVSDAVSSWGRYKGPHSFADFKSALTALCKRKGDAFTAALPKEWTDSKSLNVVMEFIKSMDPQSLPLNVQAALAQIVPEAPVVEDQDSKSVSEDAAAAANAAAAVSDDADALLALNSARIKAALAAIELSKEDDNV